MCIFYFIVENVGGKPEVLKQVDLLDNTVCKQRRAQRILF